jgi:uncharacterized protein
MRTESARQEAVIFCVLTFALSWGWWGLRFVPLLQSEQPINRAQLGPLDVQIAMLAPLLVALFSRLWISKEGMRGSLGLKRSWRIYAAAYFLPLVLGTAAVAFNHLTGLARFDLAGDSPWTIAFTILLFSLPAVLTALGEEYGWRGYLLPRLLTAGDIKGTIVMGLIWGLWHLPLVLVGLIYPDQIVFVGMLIFISATVMLSFFFTAFYHLSAGSVAVAAVIHGALNVISELSSPQYITHGSPFLTNPLGIPTALLLFAAGAALLAARHIRQKIKKIG